MPTAKILVVDDDPDVVEVTRIVLQSAGYEVVTAGNGAEGLAMVKAEQPDLMLLDVMMRTVTDGLDACLALREDAVARYLPVVMLTSIAATDHSGAVSTEQAACADAWLSKPVNPQHLLETVGRLLEGE
ncbi:MAG: response regulator [Chloroflexi bacterium]|nr:response regulator [Chloroflexota bacterium]